jgi:hypothetical protein
MRAKVEAIVYTLSWPREVWLHNRRNRQIGKARGEIADERRQGG